MENNLNKWKNGLSQTRKSTFGKIAAFFGASEISPDTWEELEALFIQADIGVKTSLDLLDGLQTQVKEEGLIRTEDLRKAVEQELHSRLIAPPNLTWENNPFVILVVGVNGSGKTTTLAKLGTKFQKQGKSVLFTAADTYRAAAVEQIQAWGKRLEIPVIAGQKDGDPGAVVYDGVQAAVARKKDVLLIDTAGRLHTRYNLMEELKKIHRVAGKALKGAPHACWLVMDATTGQNALLQAQAFKEAIPLDGIILAKLDSSAKGGMVFAIQENLGLPILFAGLGEGPGDLIPFNPEAFVAGLLNQT
ncbi:MAG: signal recognition particle-docking protein FtsY [Anaerolineales bacterium]|nr:signal recognition particle-docking protein FtsY [Anaerolineales bacterium]